MAFFLREWAPPQDWEEVEVMPEAVTEALHETGRSLQKQSAPKAVGTMGWLFLTVLKKKSHGGERQTPKRRMSM